MEILDGVEKVKRWHEEFNIRNFFDKDNPKAREEQYSAYALLTEEQYINILCNGDGTGNHIDANFEVSAAIMGIDVTKNNGVTALFDDNIIDEATWKYFQILKNECVEFRMINEIDMYECDIFIPDKITINGYYVLESYLKKISQALSDILETEDLFYYSDDFPKTNDYRKILEYAIIRIDNNLVHPKDLNIIGTTVNQTVSR